MKDAMKNALLWALFALIVCPELFAHSVSHVAVYYTAKHFEQKSRDYSDYLEQRQELQEMRRRQSSSFPSAFDGVRPSDQFNKLFLVNTLTNLSPSGTLESVDYIYDIRMPRGNDSIVLFTNRVPYSHKAVIWSSSYHPAVTSSLPIQVEKPALP